MFVAASSSVEDVSFSDWGGACVLPASATGGSKKVSPEGTSSDAGELADWTSRDQISATQLQRLKHTHRVLSLCRLRDERCLIRKGLCVLWRLAIDRLPGVCKRVVRSKVSLNGQMKSEDTLTECCLFDGEQGGVGGTVSDGKSRTPSAHCSSTVACSSALRRPKFSSSSFRAIFHIIRLCLVSRVF